MSTEKWYFWTVVLEKTLESPLDCKKIQLVHSKGDQSWVFIGRTDVEAETPILWPLDARSWVFGKYPDAGKDWGQEEKGTTEDKMVELASPTQWTWVWVSSGSWWWTGKPGILQAMGSQRVGHDWETELNWVMVNTFSWTRWPFVRLLWRNIYSAILLLINRYVKVMGATPTATLPYLVAFLWPQTLF